MSYYEISVEGRAQLNYPDRSGLSRQTEIRNESIVVEEEPTIATDGPAVIEIALLPECEYEPE